MAKRARHSVEFHEVLLKRITADPAIFGGKPIVRGMRVSVELILSLLARGEEPEEILADYPDLESENIRACLAYRYSPRIVLRRRVIAKALGGRTG